MPELPTYTASGRISPVAQQGPSIDAAMRPFEATQRLGAEIAGVGSQVALLARDRNAALEQKKKEDELTWVSNSLNSFGRVVSDRHLEDGKKENLRATEGEEFDQFAGNQISEMSAAAPSKRAAEVFRTRARSIANDVLERASRRGETVRLEAIEVSNDKAASDLAQAYRSFSATVGPEIAATTVAPLLKSQLASIDERFGQTAPTLAAKMRLAVVEEVATATAATNPDFARQVVAASGATAETKLLLNNRIEAIQSSAMELERSRFMRTLDDNRTIGLKAGAEVPEVADDEFKMRFGSRWQVVKEAYDADRKDINTANSLLRGLGEGANPIEQAKAANDALRSGDPAKVKAAGTMRQAAAAAYELATKDPVAWQEANDPDIQLSMQTLATLPEDAQAQFRAGVAYQRMARQGFAPPGDPHPERYLSRDRVYSISAAEADARKRRLAEADPDTKLRLLSDLEAEFGDPVIANKVYSDMIELGEEKIPVTYRFAGIINNPQTRKEFVAAQTNAKALDALDDTMRKTYAEVLDQSGSAWGKFQAGWYGSAGEGNQDISDAKAALISYAQHLHVGQRLEPKAAMEAAIQRVIGDNYGFADVHGRVIPIGKKRMDGGPDRTDDEIKDMSRRLTVALKDVPVREISITGPDGSPLFPNLPPAFDQNKPEDAQILRDFITRNGYWEMDSTGEMVTLMVADQGRDGFAIRDKDGQPLTAKLDDIPSYTITGRDMPMFESEIRFAPDLEQPKGTYPIKTEHWWNRIGIAPSQIKTNWPTRPTWMGRDGRNFRLD